MPRGDLLSAFPVLGGRSRMASTVLSLLNADLLGEHYARGLWRKDTIYTLAAAHAARTPDRPALRDGHRSLTWG